MELSIEQAERLPALPPWIIYNFDLGEFSARDIGCLETT